MTAGELLGRAIARLRIVPGIDPFLEARVLLRRTAGFTDLEIFAFPGRPVTMEAARRFFRAVEDRRNRIPLAYILREKEFWSIPMTVSPAVLIPRPETELLVERALALMDTAAPLIIEIGTGSGCLAIALAKEIPGARIVATDISRRALRVAEANAARHGAGNIWFIGGDLFDFWQANFSRVLTSDFGSRLIKKLGEMKVTYVIGNHDIDLVGFVDQKLLSPALFKSLSAPFSRKIGGKTFYFMHGHEVDPYNNDEVPGKGRLLTIFAGMAETLAGSPTLPDGRSVESALEQTGEGALSRLKVWGRRLLAKILLLFGSQSNDTSPAQNPDRAAEMLLNYKAHKEQNKYDVLIVGHTHQPGHMDGWYFNTGSWATTDNNFARIYPTGDVQLFDWNNGAPQRNETVLSLPRSPEDSKR